MPRPVRSGHRLDRPAVLLHPAGQPRSLPSWTLPKEDAPRTGPVSPDTAGATALLDCVRVHRR
ncbi:hypothetical protein [Streptomyces minutiscleroticus]|uniref:hypothetical protein n=1 Tax=Streptomyces minutiscleroticus TaxID=68238 RepID=UPI00331F7AA0